MENNTSVSRTTDIIMGAGFALVCLVEFVVYLPCWIVIKTDKHIKDHSCFRLMAHLGIADFGNLIGQFIAAVLVATGWCHNMPYWEIITKVLGACQVTPGWFAYVVILHLITLNRFAMMCLPGWVEQKFFSYNATTMWIRLCWCYAGLWWLAFMSPFSSFIYIPKIYCFYFDLSQPFSVILQEIDWWQNFILLNLAGIYYIAIYIYLRAIRSRMMNPQERRMAARERRILAQALVVYLYTFPFDLYWHGGPTLLSKYGFKHPYALGNLLWIGNAGVNPLVYLTINKTVRRKVKVMLCGEKPRFPPLLPHSRSTSSMTAMSRPQLAETEL